MANENISLKKKKNKVKVGLHFQPDRLAFNFSFLTEERKYNLNSKGINKNVTNALVKKLYFLSQKDLTTTLYLPKETGLERLDIEMRFRQHSDFSKSGRELDCWDGYWCFRLNKLGRVIGKITGTTFYVLCIDTSFDAYDHGS